MVSSEADRVVLERDLVDSPLRRQRSAEQLSVQIGRFGEHIASDFTRRLSAGASKLVTCVDGGSELAAGRPKLVTCVGGGPELSAGAPKLVTSVGDP